MWLLIGTAAAPAVAAQSVVSGTISGVVRDARGAPLAGALVRVRDPDGSVAGTAETTREGRYAIPFVPPGTYEVLVELLGHRPAVVAPVPVRAGREVTVPVLLVASPPPVGAPERVPFAEGISGLSRPGAAWALAELELALLPDVSRDLAAAARFTPVSAEDLQTEGLPGRLAGLAVDGVPHLSTVHPAVPDEALRAIAFGRLAAAEAELLTNGLDVEWSGAASATLSGHTPRGTRRLRVRAFGDWSGRALASSGHFEPGDVSHNVLRGGALVTGPIVRDTAHFALGVEGRRVEAPRPPAWEATPLDDALVAAAAGAGADLSGFLAPRLVETDAVTAFARLDWRVTPRHAVTVRANFASYTTADPELGPDHVPDLGSEVRGTAVAASAALASRLSATAALEVRTGLEVTAREYTGSELPATLLAEGPAAFGMDPALPGTFDRVAAHLTGVLHGRTGDHRLKVGAAATLSSVDFEYDFARGGWFGFGGPSELAAAAGAYEAFEGPAPASRFTLPRFAVFLQDTWHAAPGVELLVGVRIDAERFPEGEVAPNAALLERTGLALDSLSTSGAGVSPRVGLVWDVAGRGKWIVQAGLGVHRSAVDPGIVAEVATRSAGVTAREGAGALGSWPEAPAEAAAPTVGETVTLLGPDFEPPRTFRASLGLSAALDRFTALHVAGVYRHTDFLPRRHDLNLTDIPTAQDQYGRPIYGDLVKSGALLSADPGANRRFAGYAAIVALDADGSSDYVGVTLGLERRLAALSFQAAYTYSRTEDNWLGGGGMTPDLQLTPFPDSLDGADWADGRSDFDAPHRVVLGAALDLRRVRVAAFYRYRSGRPFTPGLRDGVDANADGSARNDPAFVDGTLPGMADLLAAWSCLAEQNGRFVERNSCRAPGVHTLDARLAVFPSLRVPVSLVVDALNVLDADPADVDRALYLLDPVAPLVVDPASGAVAVPLLVNPQFGEPVRRWAEGRRVRVGLRVEL